MKLEKFTENFQSVIIATLDDEGYPFSSYAPFVRFNGRYYTLLSDLAAHSKNIQKRAKSSLFFIESEDKAENSFARKRATITCDALLISKDQPIFEQVLSDFTAEHGEMAKMLMQMNDFNLYEFTPIYGEATFGFGAAYTLSTEDFDTLVPRSHR